MPLLAVMHPSQQDNALSLTKTQFESHSMKYQASFRQSLALWLMSCLMLCSVMAHAADEPVGKTVEESALEEQQSAVVMVDGQMLFKVRGTSVLPAGQRAQNIADRIVALAADPKFSIESLRVDESQAARSVILSGTKPLLVVLDADAAQEGIDRQSLALIVVRRIGEAITTWRQDRVPATLLRNALIALGAGLVFGLALWGGARLYRRLRAALETRMHQRIHDVQIKGFNIFRAQQIWALLTGLIKFFWAALLLTAIYVYLSSILVLFPWTRGLANKLIALLIDPLRTLGQGFLDMVPDLVFLLILFLITRYVLKLTKLYFQSLADGSFVMEGFDQDWAMPTYRLTRPFLIAFALIVAYPYIPGSDSQAFKGVSLFIGVIFSLGSSSIIGNIIAGYSMTYRRVFKVGDLVRIGEHTGKVEQVSTLVTYLRTLKNEFVAIPNSKIIDGEVVNYSALSGTAGLILHTTVGIGYETPWRQVEAMLLEAAARTPELLREPQPFVLQKLLGDFCVTYEINAYCATAQGMPRVYTELHRHILDIFNEYGVQIMTPAYEADTEQPKVVPKEQWYAAPASPPQASTTN